MLTFTSFHRGFRRFSCILLALMFLTLPVTAAPVPATDLALPLSSTLLAPGDPPPASLSRRVAYHFTKADAESPDQVLKYLGLYGAAKSENILFYDGTDGYEQAKKLASGGSTLSWFDTFFGANFESYFGGADLNSNAVRLACSKALATFATKQVFFVGTPQVGSMWSMVQRPALQTASESASKLRAGTAVSKVNILSSTASTVEIVSTTNKLPVPQSADRNCKRAGTCSTPSTTKPSTNEDDPSDPETHTPPHTSTDDNPSPEDPSPDEEDVSGSSSGGETNSNPETAANPGDDSGEDGVKGSPKPVRPNAGRP